MDGCKPQPAGFPNQSACPVCARRRVRVSEGTDRTSHTTTHRRGNEVSDSVDGKRIIPWNATDTFAIHMDSDEWWPNRAYIELTVTNN